MADNQNEFKPLGVIECPTCQLSSLSWNMTCARCGSDLMPEDDDAMRHKQENAA